MVAAVLGVGLVARSRGGVATISVAPPAIDLWQARLGRVVASDQHAFSRLEIDVAPQLVPMPKQAQVVFVLDTSYSIGEDGVAAQLDLVRVYMHHVPDADIEIVTYRRRAKPAYVFGADAHHELSAAEQMKVAMFGRAVSPVTSYIAAEPSVRPSTIGLEEGQFGFGRSGFGAGGGGAGFGAIASSPNWRRLIETATCVEKLRPTAPWSVTLKIETSFDEVLDVVVHVTRSRRSAHVTSARQLAIGLAWFFQSNDHHTVELSGPAAR